MKSIITSVCSTICAQECIEYINSCLAKHSVCASTARHTVCYTGGIFLTAGNGGKRRFRPSWESASPNFDLGGTLILRVRTRSFGKQSGKMKDFFSRRLPLKITQRTRTVRQKSLFELLHESVKKKKKTPHGSNFSAECCCSCSDTGEQDNGPVAFLPDY